MARSMAWLFPIIAITVATSAWASPAPPVPSPSANPQPAPAVSTPAPAPASPRSRPATTPAAPAPAPAPTPGPAGGAEECGWLDFGCKVNHALNGWFGSIVTEAIQPAFQMVGTLLLSSPPPSMLERVQELSGHVRLVANALLVLFVLAGGLIVMAYGSVQTSATAQEIIPRLVVAVIALNTSLIVCQHAVELANGLVAALLGDGVDARRAGDLMANKITNPIGQLQGPQMFLIWMIGLAVVMGIILAFIGVLRVALLLFLIIAAPLALLCHALPQTEHIARLWWRAFTGVLVMQVLQALVLILAFKVYFTDSTDAFATSPDEPVLAVTKPVVMRAVDALVLIGLLFILIKIPGWVARSVWQHAQPQLLQRLVKALIVYKTLGMASAALRAGKASRSAGAARRSGTASGPGRPGRRGPSGPRPRGGSPRRRGPQPVNASAHTSPTTPSAAGGSHAPQQLALPLNLPPAPAPAPASRGRGRQLALPFPVTRVPRPPMPAPPPAPSGPWIRPRPPWVQPMLPGMPTRPARPRQLHLRLDPPPRHVPRGRRDP
ncbi:hypothetical protein GBF35_45915 [Nonomuraea phyllanthi]|uniref:hypothetical protein n=1 Tax=Nonomuraea phyllanthi TaxID=2219224 RepID=UPI00129337C6|nr:hypothetical protein [Nonomuraea phyllanthi]QFY12926.1 hypothetical protein GBF35_45915 [Nonomuraea phyllanthi]